MPAPNRTVEGYTHILGSSDYGGCIKASVARLLGYEPLPPSERMQALYDRGNVHEDVCLQAMLHEKWTLSDRQREEVIDCGDGWGVVIHYDAFGYDYYNLHQAMDRCIEVKSPSTWASFERAVRTGDFSNPYMDRIAWQVSAQMIAAGLEAVIACYDGAVRTFGIELPIYTREQIVARVQAIRWAAAEGAPPSACTSDDYPCPFVYLHEDPPRDVDPDLDEMGLQRARLLAEKKSLELGIKDIEDAIKTHCEGCNVKTELVTVTTYSQAGPAKWDTDLMVADGIDPDKYRIAGKPSMRTKITTKGE